MKNIEDKQGNLIGVQGVSPAGTFKYPHLNTPDFGTEEYPKEGGEYNVKLILNSGQAEAFREALSELHELADTLGQAADKKRKPPARKKSPYTLNEIGNDVYDENDEPTGDVEFAFKTKASGKDAKGKAWEKVLPLFDAKAKTIEDCAAIYGGTVGKLSFTAKAYWIAGQGMAGVSLYLNGAQILELVSGGASATAEGMGFGEEDGYEAPEVEAEDDGGFDDESEVDDADDGAEDF